MNKSKKENADRWEQYNFIIDSTNLNLKEKGLLLILFRFVNYRTQYANPSRKLIKELTGISNNSTLDNLMKSLIKKNFLTRDSGYKGTTSKYYLNIKLDKENQLSTKLPLISREEIIIHDNKNHTSEKENKIYMDLKFIDDSIDQVKITKEEYDKLLSKYDGVLINKTILDLDCYLSNGSNKYKDHYKTINNWCMKSNDNNKANLNKPVESLMTTNEQEFYSNIY